MKTMSALENQGESIDRWEEVVDGINQVEPGGEHRPLGGGRRWYQPRRTEDKRKEGRCCQPINLKGTVSWQMASSKPW